MPPKTLALALFSEDEAQWLLPRVVDLATRFQAHLLGLAPNLEILAFAGAYGEVGATALAELYALQEDRRNKLEEMFRTSVRIEDFASEYRAQAAAEEGAESFLLGNGRGADLLVFGQCGPDTPGMQRRLLDHAIRHSGRPVLVVPPSWVPGPIGRRILIGWSDTPEATRAAHDALMVAGPGAVVDILHAGPTGAARQVTYREDLAAAFDRQGFEVSLLEHGGSSADAGQTLLNVAQDRACDMIAVGAFGHSRAYDFVIGAVTQHLLDAAEIPVLFSR